MVETSQPLYQNRHRGNEEWDLRLIVEEARKLDGLGNGVVLVRTKERDDSGHGHKSWMLMGNRKQDDSLEGLAHGRLVGIRRPVWDVSVGEELWGVAVEWSAI